MRKNFTLPALILLVLFCSCHRYYTSASFAEKAVKHKTIAILPPQLVVSGNLPNTVSDYEIEHLEEKESKVFQEALYSNVLKRANSGKYQMSVSVQPYTNTLAALDKYKISIRDSWTKDDQELAAVLGVDAVVRTSIQKERFMSDLASAGIEAGKRILDAVLTKTVLLPGVINKTNNIRASCSIISKGETLWNDSYKRESNYNNTANQIIEDITDNFAKHFPYKIKA